MKKYIVMGLLTLTSLGIIKADFWEDIVEAAKKPVTVEETVDVTVTRPARMVKDTTVTKPTQMIKGKQQLLQRAIVRPIPPKQPTQPMTEEEQALIVLEKKPIRKTDRAMPAKR